MDLQDFYGSQYEPLALRTRAANTKRLYRSTIIAFNRFLKRPARLSDLQDVTVSRFAAWRLSHGLAKHTVNKDLFNLLAMWRWAHRKGFVANWPDVQLENAPQRAPVALLRDELESLLQAARNAEGWIGENLARHWWPALLLVLWDTGERIGAVLALDWCNVDLRAKWVRFVAESRKWSRRDSQQRIGGDTADALRNLTPKRGLVFPWEMHYGYLWRIYAKLCEAAGLPDDRLHLLAANLCALTCRVGSDA